MVNSKLELTACTSANELLVGDAFLYKDAIYLMVTDPANFCVCVGNLGAGVVGDLFARSVFQGKMVTRVDLTITARPIFKEK